MTGVLDLLRGGDRLMLRLPFGRGLDVEIFECPGRWLDAAALAALVEDMRRVAAAGQKGKPVPLYGALAGDRTDLAHRVITLIRRRDNGAPVAFSALCYLDLDVAGAPERLVHLGLAYVDGTERGRGLASVLYGLANFFLFLRNGLRPFWVSSVTQVPAVFGLVGEHYDCVFPSQRAGARQTFAHLLRARAIMRDHRAAFGVGEEAGFDEINQVISNSYTGGSDDLKKTFAETAQHRDDRVNEMCRRSLDYDRGDDFLQIGCWTVGTTLRFLRESAPRFFAARTLVQAAALVFASLVVPVVRWLMPAEPLQVRGD